eukprot:m.48625 g.48625  ORF g.48625 m.48625 type:complete len:351 (-) comp13303_c0_seq3:34-1086(-)
MSTSASSLDADALVGKPKDTVSQQSVEIDYLHDDEAELAHYDKLPLRIRARAEAWELEVDQVKLGDQFASGAFGSIFRGRWRGLDVAVKKLRPEVAQDPRARADLIHEIYVLSHLRHPGLTMFLGAVTEGDTPMIVFEYCHGGNFLKHYEAMQTKKHFQWKPRRSTALGWCLDLARALCFLHNCNPTVIHRDIKPENLLLTQDQRLKLTDFGISKEMQRRRLTSKPTAITEPYVMTGKTGSKRWMAPEVFKCQPSYDESVDIYSFGMVAFFLLVGWVPFRDIDGDVIAARAAGQERLRPPTSTLEPKLGQLLSRCWAESAKARPSAETLVDELEALLLQGIQTKKECALM